MKMKNGRQIFIVNNRLEMFYPVQEIIIEMLEHWNKEAQYLRFDLGNEKDWLYAAGRLAAAMGADKFLVTDDYKELIRAFNKSKIKRP